MSSSIDRFLTSIDEGLRQATQATREGLDQASPPSSYRRGIVTAVTGNTYTVEVRDANGGAAMTLTGIYAWLDDAIAPGTRVQLMYEDGRPMPWIIGAGNGSSEVCHVPLGVTA